MTRSSLVRFLKDRSGQALLIFGLASPIAIGGAGMAVDVSMWVRQKDSLQLLADSAALAAASELARSGSTSEKMAKAETVAKGFVDSNGDGRTIDVVVDVAAMKADVTVSEPARISFGKMFGISDFDLAAESTASLAVAEARACVIALDESAKVGVNISGTGDFLAPDCWVKSHSTSDTSITIGGSATVKAAMLCAAGKTRVNGASAEIDASTPKWDECYEGTDPYAALEYPLVSMAGCQKNVSLNVKTNVTLSGKYCGDLTVNSDGNVTIASDLYVEGNVKITAKGNVTGEGVTIFLMDESSSFDVAGQGHVSLSAPAMSGDLPGVVLVSPQSKPAGKLPVSRISGGAYVDLSGSVYLPFHDFVWRGNSKTADPSVITMVIANTVDIAGTATIKYEPNATAAGYPEVTIKPLVSYLAK